VSESVSLELGRVAYLELVNPPLNLITRELLEALDAALATLAEASADAVRVVVVTGSGERAFSAGSHVGEFESQAALKEWLAKNAPTFLPGEK